MPVVLPDPQTEKLGPDEDKSMSNTQKALEILSQMLVKAQPEMPDTTGSAEGKFKVSLPQMIKYLNEIVSAEYSQWLRYFHYGLVLRGHGRDALTEEFSKHADEELDHASTVALRIVGLGGYPVTQVTQPKPLRETEDILKELLYHEQEGVALYRKVMDACGENVGTRVLLEDNVSNEQEHIDELWRYLKNPDLIKAQGSMPISEKRYNRGQRNSYSRVSSGSVGAGNAGPDLPERGRDWHGTVPGVPDEDQTPSEDVLDKEPTDLLKYGEKKKKADEEAKKALAGAALFAAPLAPTVEQEFMLANGYTQGEISSGAQMTPRLRAMYNRRLTAGLNKSLESFSKKYSVEE
jgi:bacterioferritin